MKRTLSEAERRSELAGLAALADDQIDTRDIPEAPPENWAQAQRGLYRPVKTPISLRLDADVLHWFREQSAGRGYQTEINRVLRHHVSEARKRREA